MLFSLLKYKNELLVALSNAVLRCISYKNDYLAARSNSSLPLPLSLSACALCGGSWQILPNLLSILLLPL